MFGRVWTNKQTNKQELIAIKHAKNKSKEKGTRATLEYNPMYSSTEMYHNYAAVQ